MKTFSTEQIFWTTQNQIHETLDGHLRTLMTDECKKSMYITHASQKNEISYVENALNKHGGCVTRPLEPTWIEVWSSNMDTNCNKQENRKRC